MVYGIRFTAFLACSLALAGCASSDLMLKRQTEAEAKIELLSQTEKLDMQRMNQLSAQVQNIEEQNREAAALIKRLQESIQELRSSQDELRGRPAASSRSGVQKIEVVNKGPAAKGKEGGPPAAYLSAFGFYSANNYLSAIEAFEAFLKQNPQSEYAANASYWIGECHYSRSDFAKARASFQKTIDNYPKNAKMPDAMLKLGYTLAALKEKDKKPQIKPAESSLGNFAATTAKD